MAQDSMPPPIDQPITGTDRVTAAVSEIYDQLTENSFTLDEKQAVLRGYAKRLRQDIDDQIKSLEALRSSF